MKLEKILWGLGILWSRFTRQGLRVTALWVADHGVRIFTGAPIRRVSQITPHLHVGGQYRRRGWPRLAARGVTSVVNMRVEFDDNDAGIAPERYLYLPTVDDDPPTLEQLRAGAAFIAEEIARGGGVYVHCGAGVGRAATMAAAYLVSTGLTPDDAWAKIREARPFVRPRSRQVAQVESFAERECGRGTESREQKAIPLMNEKPMERQKRVFRAADVLRGFLGAIVAMLLFLFAYLGLPASAYYRVTERYLFTAPDEEALISLGVLVPRSGPYQTVENLRVVWDGEEERRSEKYVDVIRLDGIVEGGASQEAVIDYEVILPQGRVVWDAPMEDFQLSPQADIESDHPTIVALAAEIAGGSSRGDAYHIYKFASRALSWPQGTRIDVGSSALVALETGVGGCTEFANVTAALCRVSGIPAQTISGLIMPTLPPFWPAQTRMWLHPGGAHAWVEFHTRAGWEMADPSWASSPLPAWIWFGRNDGLHLSYGEAGLEERIFEETLVWASRHGHSSGWMSAPLRFAVGSDSENVTVTPSVTLKKGWDGRWFNAFGAVILFAVLFGSLENWLKRKQTPPVTGGVYTQPGEDNKSATNFTN
jgi:protein tyrosine phosphatase (PTP) superfamily phosphohydrolase (DUF442 family)